MKRYRPTVDTAQVMSTSRWWVPDTAMWFVAVWAATWARFDFELEHVEVGPTAIVAMTAVIANGVVGSAMGIYRHRYIVASFEECAALATVAVVSSALLQVTVSLVEPYSVPRSVPVLAGMFALGGIAGCSMARSHIGAPASEKRYAPPQGCRPGCRSYRPESDAADATGRKNAV